MQNFRKDMVIRMAGLITHMAVAREINKQLPKGTIGNLGLFYLGNLAPDAIHVREGYERALKKHTHFRDDILDREFGEKKNLELFHHRLTDFINEYKDFEDELFDLYRGYVVHNLVDELYILTIREEFCKTFMEFGIDQDDPLFIESVITDMIRNDFILIKNYEGIDEIRSCLEKAPVYPVSDFIRKEEINSCREWLLSYYIYGVHEILPPVFIRFDETLEFIRMAAENIVIRLSEGKDFPKIL